MKRFLLSALLLFSLSAVFAQVPDNIKQELIDIYTAYAEANTVEARLAYIRNPEKYKEILEQRYENKKIGYSPIRFGDCNISSANDQVYILVEYVSASRGIQEIEVRQRRYFVKTNEEFKIDWESSFCYNPVSFSRFQALKDGNIETIRCYASLSESRFDDYFAFDIRDEVLNYEFKAYAKKDQPQSLELLDLLDHGKAQALILNLKYSDIPYSSSSSSKEVVITELINKNWVMN